VFPLEVNKRNVVWIIVFLFPTILLLVFFYAYSIVTVAGASFFEWRLGSKMTFAGLQHFKTMIQDRVFIASFKNTIIWLVLHWVVLTGTALLMALLTAKKTKFARFSRVCYLIPNMVPLATIGFLFYFIFNPSIGLVNGAVSAIIGKPFVLNWFANGRTAFFSVTITTILYGGVYALLMSSEISAIPEEVYESANIDGANPLQANLYIVLPLLRNILGTCLILSTVQCLKTFEVIYLTTSGGPGIITMNLPVLIFRTALNNNNYGYANAVSLVTIIMGVACIGIITKSLRLGKSDY
jgi:raffinose/stachyose/melibiose transport system permease protein